MGHKIFIHAPYGPQNINPCTVFERGDSTQWSAPAWQHVTGGPRQQLENDRTVVLEISPFVWHFL